MRFEAEPVERAAHVHFLAGLHVEERKVHCAAAAVPRLLCDVAALEQHGLVKVAVEIRLHPRVADIGRPADEMRDRPLRTVGVVYLQPIAAPDAVVARRPERTRGLLRQKRARLFVSVDAFADKVVGRIVPRLENRVRHRLGERDKSAASGDIHLHTPSQHNRKRPYDSEQVLLHRFSFRVKFSSHVVAVPCSGSRSGRGR